MTTYHFTIETADYTGYGEKKGKIEIEKDNIDKINDALNVFFDHRDKLEGKLHDLIEKQDDEPLLFYPFSIEDSKDLKKKKNFDDRFILEIHKNNGDYTLKTGCLMGFISATFKEDDKTPNSDDYHFNIYIHSRFDSDWYRDDSNNKNPKIRYDGKDEDFKCKARDDNNAGLSKDYFLHYMLQRVLNINLSRNPSTGEDESNLELMLYFFPAMLHRAMKQGFYKRYVHHEYNDARVRGTIDVSRHIARNYPFCGKIAYSATEYDLDNPITQLVRHTIEYIRCHEWANELLSQSDKTRMDVRDIVENTERYNVNERQRIIKQNMRLLNHPFYTEWRPLQHLCLAILRHDDLRYDRANDEDCIHGVLFDGPWLWEKYLATVFEDTPYINNYVDFEHPDNTTKDGGVWDGMTYRYPDFYLKNKEISDEKDKNIYAKEIWDAKFKPKYETDDIDSDDRLQLVGYMWIMSKRDVVISEEANQYKCYLCQRAGFVSPIRGKSMIDEVHGFSGLSGHVYKWQLGIAESKSGIFMDFSKNMKSNEKEFIEKYFLKFPYE